MVMVVEVLPKPKLRVPEEISKSPAPSIPPVALPFTVWKSTRTPPPMPPVRCTVSVTLPAFSLTEYLSGTNLITPGEIHVGDRDERARLALDDLGRGTLGSG